MQKMKIEVWSDIMCPFCYIGKRKLDKSLKELPNSDHIEIEWKSYQLNPELVTDTTIGIDDYLSQQKGMSLAEAKQMGTQVSAMAKEEGLIYNMDQAVVANSFRAHVLTHFAKKSNKQNEAEELLFKSYFTEGKNIDDLEELKGIAAALDLDVQEFVRVVEAGELDDEVKMDIHEARQIGVRGVPFFVYNRKYAISGAQPQELFAETLRKSLEEWSGSSQLQVVNKDESGDSCGVDGCD